MKQRIECAGLTGGLLTVLAVLVMAGSAFAANALRIQPTRHDCGIVEEGVPATMLAIVENVSSQEVQIKNVRTN